MPVEEKVKKKHWNPRRGQHVPRESVPGCPKADAHKAGEGTLIPKL